MEEYVSQRTSPEHGVTRRKLLAGTAGLGVWTIAGCARSGQEGREGSIRIGLPDNPVEGDWEAYGGVTPYYTPFHETLTAAAPDLASVEKGLATAWDHPDDTTWQFSLREGVTFHDGTELTASITADALAALIEARPIGFTRFTPDSFEAADEYRLTVTTTQPAPATPGNLAHPLLSLQHPETDEPVGTGPYVAEPLTTDEAVEATTFEDYWGEPASVPLVFESVLDPQTRSLKLEAGELGVALDLPRESYGELDESDDVRVRTKTEPRTGMIMVNRYLAPTDDADLRRALLYATDQTELVEEILDGIGEPARSPFSKVIEWSAHDDLPEYTDMNRARELVESSDYEGEPLRFIVSGEESEQRLIAEELQRRYDEIGVDVTIEQIESAAFFSEYRAGKANLAFVELGSINGAADYLVYVMFHSKGGDNRDKYEDDGTGVVNPGEEVDTLIERGDTAFDERIKHEAYRAVQHRVMEDGVTIPIYYKEYVLGARAAIEAPDLHAIPHMIDWTTVSK